MNLFNSRIVLNKKVRFLFNTTTELNILAITVKIAPSNADYINAYPIMLAQAFNERAFKKRKHEKR